MMPNIRLIFVFAQLLVVCLSEQIDEGNNEIMRQIFGYTTAKPDTIALNPTVKSLSLPSYLLEQPTASPPCQNVCGQYQQLTTSPCQIIPGEYQTIPEGCQTTIEPSTEVKYVGYEYSNLTGHWYKFHAGPVVNWTDAREACWSDGADLAVPNSDTEAKVLMGLFARSLNSEITNTDWPDWVSVGILWDNGAFKTVDGQLLSQSGYSRWLKGYPGDDHNYPYVVMNRGGDLSTTRSVLYPFVCEKKRVRAEVIINYR